MTSTSHDIVISLHSHARPEPFRTEFYSVFFCFSSTSQVALSFFLVLLLLLRFVLLQTRTPSKRRENNDGRREREREKENERMKERKKVNENKKETKCTSKIRAKGNGVEVVAPRWRPINGVVSRRRSDPMPAFDESQASKKPKRKKNNKNNNNNHKKKTATAQQKTSRAAQIDHRTSLEATPFFFNLISLIISFSLIKVRLDWVRLG